MKIEEKERRLTIDTRESTVDQLVRQLDNLPEEALTHLYSLAIATGCANCCTMCSTGSASTITILTEQGIRDLIDAMVQVRDHRRSKDKNQGYYTDSRAFKPGHVLVYGDDDPGCHPDTDILIEQLYEKIGLKSAISTIGWSRHNQQMQSMHRRIASQLHGAIKELRISYSSSAQGWKNREEFTLDIANMLANYYPLVAEIGIGKNGMRVEIHSQPLVFSEDKPLDESIILDHHVLHAGPYLLISQGLARTLSTSSIINVGGKDGVLPQFDTEPVTYLLAVSDEEFNQGDWPASAQKIIKGEPISKANHQQRIGDLYQLKNSDGPFYVFDPSFSPEGYVRSIHIYPQTEKRKRSGVLDTTRYFLNSLLRYKQDKGLGWLDSFPEAKWEDVILVMNDLQTEAERAREFNKKVATFLQQEIIPLVVSYAYALKLANYQASLFFEPNFTIDTGPICNSGRAKKLFLGLASEPDIPLTIDDLRREFLYHQRKQLWRWRPIPYRRSAVGMKAKLGPSGSLLISPFSWTKFESIDEQENVITGLETREIPYNVAKRCIPGVSF